MNIVSLSCLLAHPLAPVQLGGCVTLGFSSRWNRTPDAALQARSSPPGPGFPGVGGWGSHPLGDVCLGSPGPITTLPGVPATLESPPHSGTCFFVIELLFLIIIELFPHSAFLFPHLFSNSVWHTKHKCLVTFN